MVIESMIVMGVLVGVFSGVRTFYKDRKSSEGRTFDEWVEFLESIQIKNKSGNQIEYVKEGEGFVLFRVPYGISNDDIRPKEVYFNQFLQSSRVEYNIKNNWMEMKYYMEELPEMIKFELVPTYSNDIKVFLGKGYDELAEINFNLTPHVLLAGATNSGKSVCTHTILVQLYNSYPDLKFYLADMKKVELLNYKKLKATTRYEDTLEGVTEMVDELLAECDKRYELIGKMGCKKLETYNKKVSPTERLNPIMFVVEECVRLVSDKELQKKLAELLFIARACGIYVILTIQRPTKACLSPEIKASLGNIIGLKTVNKRNSECICDDNRLKDLKGFGHGWLFNDLGEVEYQGYYISEDEIDEYLKGL